MIRRDRFEHARLKARALHRKFGIVAPEHIEVETMASAMGAVVVRGELSGAAARLIRRRGTAGEEPRAVIRLSNRITHPGMQNFSIGHELGHLALENGDAELDVSCESAARPDAAEREQEANVFAAELLMPESMVRRRCEVSPVSLKVPREIAETFRTSLASSAIRFCELTSERCAVVYSERGSIRWSQRSPTFRAWFAKGKLLDRRTVADDIACKGRGEDEAQPIPADAWLDTDSDADLIEHSTPIPQTRGVLSLLWVPERVAARLDMRDD